MVVVGRRPLERPANVSETCGKTAVDASHIAWGCQLDDKCAYGEWNRRLSNKSSNYRELMAVLLGLQSFAILLRGKTVQVLSDNITAIAYVTKLGGMEPELCTLAETIWSTALQYEIHLVMRHIAGKFNVAADYLSRMSDPYNWMLKRSVFNYIDLLFGPHTIDRFASCVNTQLSAYNSRFYDPGP